jgi:hypothetical protein
MKLSEEQFVRISDIIGEITEADRMAFVATTPSRLHDEARGIARGMDAISDVREDIVASLRERVESGSYHVSGEQIAEMLLRRMHADNLR